VQELVKENNGAKQSFLAAFYLMIFNFVKVAIRAILSNLFDFREFSICSCWRFPKIKKRYWVNLYNVELRKNCCSHHKKMVFRFLWLRVRIKFPTLIHESYFNFSLRIMYFHFYDVVLLLIRSVVTENSCWRLSKTITLIYTSEKFVQVC